MIAVRSGMWLLQRRNTSSMQASFSSAVGVSSPALTGPEITAVAMTRAMAQREIVRREAK